jgi:ribosomal protein S6E (S10)
MILALSVLLVIPAVVAVASSGVDTVGTPAVTADRVQEQARDCGDCLYGAPERDQVRDRDQDQTKAPDVAGDRDQVQKQLRIHDPVTAGDQVQTREREQVRDQSNCDGDGLQMREQVRTEAQRELKLAEQQGYGPGAETGNGPLYEGPADGTGNQFGQGGR